MEPDNVMPADPRLALRQAPESEPREDLPASGSQEAY
jgi:hypothetical protein